MTRHLPAMHLAPLTCTVVTPFGTLGGSERWLLDLLDAGRERVRATVWMLQDGPLRGELEARGVDVLVLETGTSAVAVARRAADLARRLRRSDTDVVLANGVKAAAAVVPAARLAGVPVAWAKHDFSWDHELARPLGRLADAVIATSSSVAAATGRGDAVLVPPARPTVPAAGPTEAVDFWAERGLVLAGGPTVAMLGRLVSYKGIDTAITALASDDALPWRLAVIGPDDPSEPGERARLRELAADLGVGDRVTFLGEVEGAGSRLAAFDAVAVLTRPQSSRFGREGYSIVALEALAAGVPLVGAAGNPEVERMALTAGRVVAVDDATAVASALLDLRDPEIRERCHEAAVAIIEAHPGLVESADRVVAALAALAGRPGAGIVGPPMTVLTCMKDEEGHVDAVVSAVLEQLGPDDEYLLLDDRSTDKTPVELATWASRDRRIRVLQGPGVNLSAARNVGFSEATHAVVACTDAGCLPSPTWLTALRAPFAEQDPVDLVVGVYDVDRGDPVRDASRLALFPSVTEARRRTPWVRLATKVAGRRFDRRRLDGRSMAVSVEAWERAGGFDVTLYSSEDAVFGSAVLDSGGRSELALDAQVVWEQTGDLRSMARMYASYGEWGGRSGSWQLISRDLVRGAAYVVAPTLMLTGGRRTRTVVGAGVAGYLAVPYSRARHERTDPATLALVPLVLALKDVAKAWGCARGGLSWLREERAGRGADMAPDGG